MVVFNGGKKRTPPTNKGQTLKTMDAFRKMGIAAFACIALAILTTSQNVLVTWSQRQGGYEYNYVSVTLMSEVVKFLLTAFLLLREQRKLHSIRADKADLESNKPGNNNNNNSNATAAAASSSASSVGKDKDGGGEVARIDLAHELSTAGFIERLPFAVPAFVYFLKNNLMFYGLKFLNPVQFQLLGNLKIPATTLLFWLMMKKPLTDLGWLSVILLTIGLTITQLKGDQQVDITLSSVVVMSVIALLSGFAAIATEWLMKSSSRRAAESLHVQNIWLYFYGILFNLIAIVMDDWEALWADGFFYGYNLFTVFIIFNNSTSGIAVSAIMKYANNIVKLFTFAVSLILTTVLSMIFFQFHPTLQFFLGATIVFISTYLYSRK